MPIPNQLTNMADLNCDDDDRHRWSGLESVSITSQSTEDVVASYSNSAGTGTVNMANANHDDGDRHRQSSPRSVPIASQSTENPANNDSDSVKHQPTGETHGTTPGTEERVGLMTGVEMQGLEFEEPDRQAITGIIENLRALGGYASYVSHVVSNAVIPARRGGADSGQQISIAEARASAINVAHSANSGQQISSADARASASDVANSANSAQQISSAEARASASDVANSANSGQPTSSQGPERHGSAANQANSSSTDLEAQSGHRSKSNWFWKLVGCIRKVKCNSVGCTNTLVFILIVTVVVLVISVNILPNRCFIGQCTVTAPPSHSTSMSMTPAPTVTITTTTTGTTTRFETWQSTATFATSYKPPSETS